MGVYSRKVSVAVCFVLVAFFMLWARAFYGSMKAYEQGESHLKQHEYVRAVTFFDRSLRWYTPLNPYVHKSAERLWDIGTQAQRQGNIRLALMAVRTIKQGFFAARSFYTPGKAWIGKSDAKIRELEALEPARKCSGQASEPLDTWPLRSPSGRDPSTLWSMVVEFGFLGWIGAMLGLILFAFKGTGRLRILKGRAVLWGSLALICFALWLVGIMKA